MRPSLESRSSGLWMRANHSTVKLDVLCYFEPLFQLQGLYRLKWVANMIMMGEEIRILTEALRFIWKYYIYPFEVEENYRNIQLTRASLESYRYVNCLNERVQSLWDKTHNSAFIACKYDFKVKFQVCNDAVLTSVVIGSNCDGMFMNDEQERDNRGLFHGVMALLTYSPEGSRKKPQSG